jgi:hypothetical protein
VYNGIKIKKGDKKMELKRTLKIRKASFEITVSHNYNEVDLDGHVRQTKEVVRLGHVKLYVDGKLVHESDEGFICLTDGKARFGNAYIAEADGAVIIEALNEMHAELDKELAEESNEEDTEAELVEEAERIMAEVATRKTGILTEAEENVWRRNYNNINNEGKEGYVPQRATAEDEAWAKKTLGLI